MGRILQSPLWHARIIATLAVFILAALGLEWYDAPEPNLRHRVILMSADMAALYWGFASLLMLITKPGDWFVRGDQRYLLRLSWALGFLLFAVHVVAAFHFGHGWSHAEAYRQTEETSGFSEGIFVNYLFGLVWLADALWFAVWPDRYVRRPRYIGWIVHGFLGFIVFNATVVYGVDKARFIGVFVSLAMPVCWAYGWYRRKYPEPEGGSN